MGSIHVAVTKTSDIAPVLSKESFDIQVNIEYRLTLKRVCGMIRTQRQTTFVKVPAKYRKKFQMLLILHENHLNLKFIVLKICRGVP